MYETQFGLTKRPFRALATGGDVFVGPQTAAAMAGLKKALATPDAIVSVTGPVGVGKTTVVRRALEAIGKDPVIVTVGRMQLAHDEVLELLLEELGIDMPSGTVQRFSAFRRLLLKHAQEGTRVFIVVEDAKRIGADALSELEALTASDAGVSEGANIVLMGDSGIDELLKFPQLARMRQRLRLRQEIAPLGASELLGYFKHCFRLAGNGFDTIFEDGSSEVLHRLSGGIPRVANNLVESSLISAVENKLDRVNVAQIKLVANEEYGLKFNGEPAVPEAPAAEEPAEPAPQPKPAPQPEAKAKPQPEVRPEPKPEPEPKSGPTTDTPPAPAEAAEDDIPELIQDTLPDLEVLAPELAKPAPKPKPAPPPEAQVKPQPEVRPKPQPAPQPKPQPETAPNLEAAQVEQPEEAVPEWDRDPTLAQLRPDLDALEHAMAVAQGRDADEKAAAAKSAGNAEPVPEITLDREIQAKVDKATEIIKEEEARRAEREAREREESGIDDRPISVILAEAQEKEAEEAATPDNSVEAQFEGANFMPDLYDSPPPAEPSVEDLQASTDTVTDLPLLQDMTNPAFEPAAHSEPPAHAAEPPQEIPELAIEPELQAKPEPEPAPIPELKLEDEPAPQPEPTPAPEPEPDPVQLEQARKADAELEQIAANLARAKTIDDCDDKMAETLFGEEFSMLAAEVAANAPPELSANDDDGDDEAVAAEPAEPAIPDFDGAAAISVELETKPNGMTAHLNSSASQRLATLKALNSAPPEAEPMPAPPPPEPSAPVEQPQSFEDQINTSMTQTLQALSVRDPSEIVRDDDDEGDSKKGFFSRFKRS